MKVSGICSIMLMRRCKSRKVYNTNLIGFRCLKKTFPQLKIRIKYEKIFNSLYDIIIKIKEFVQAEKSK